jgi:predicted acylesterase/phospholipase RssA
MRDGGRLNILCLSGGGFRGLYTAAVLDKITRGFGIHDLSSHFDLIIGTSTGGLVGSALALGLPPHAIASAFQRRGRSIFPRETSLRGIWQKARAQPQYSAAPIASAVKEMLPEEWKMNIEDLDVPLALVSVSRITQRHRIFAGAPFADRGIRKTSLLKAILSTSAAPTYFPEQKIGTDRLIDGGLAANAPVLLGVSLLHRKKRAHLENINVLHIGTASTPDYQRFEPGWLERNIPPLAWTRRLLGVTRDLVVLTMAAQEALAIELAKTWLGDRYVYVDAPEKLRHGPELAKLDNASLEAQRRLLLLAEETWLERKGDPALRAFFPIAGPALGTMRRFGGPRAM